MKPKTIKKLHEVRRKIATAIIFVFFFSICLIFVMPTVLTFTNSLMSKSEIAANYGQIFSSVAGDAKTYVAGETNLKLIPDMISFSQYENVLLKNPQYLFKFWNSVILTVPIVIFQIIVALFAAYGFARFSGKLRSIIFFSYVILMLMPYQVTLVPNYLVSNWLGILDTRLAIILPGIFSPFAVFILTKFMRRIPPAMIEAAKLDGCKPGMEFTHLVFPLIWPTISTMLILSFTGLFSSSGPILLFGAKSAALETTTISYWIFKEVYELGVGGANAVSATGLCFTVVAVPLILFVRWVAEKIPEVEY